MMVLLVSRVVYREVDDLFYFPQDAGIYKKQ